MRYFLLELSRSGIGSLGSLSWWAKVMPGLEFGFVWWPRGSLASEGKDAWLSFAEASERTEPFTSEVDMVRVAVARVLFSEAGWVKVRAAMVQKGQLSVQRRDASADG